MHIFISFVFLIAYTGLVFGGCGEQEQICSRYINGKMINQGNCKVVECANSSGGMQEWTWENGDSVTIDVRDKKITVNGKVGYSFNKAEMLCYGIGDQSKKMEYVCSSDRKQENLESKKEACAKLLGAGMYNGILEDICGFTGGVKEKLKKMYAAGNCNNLITQDEIKQTSKEVLEDTRARYKAMGEEPFCKGNKKAYYDLAGH